MLQQLGFQLWTVRDYLNDPELADLTFRRLREMGYTEAHTFTAPLGEDKLGELLQKNGIRVIGTHYDWEPICSDPAGTMALHRRLGTTNIGIGGMPGPARKDLGELRAFIAKFNEMAKLYSKEGFRLTYHNHNFEFGRIDGYKTIMDLLYESLEPDSTSFVLDTCWVAAGGGDVCDWMRKLKGRLDILHLKDLYLTFPADLNHPQINLAEVGTGSIAWDTVMKTAEEIGVKHYIVEQDGNFETGNSLESLAKSAAFLDHYRKQS